MKKKISVLVAVLLAIGFLAFGNNDGHVASWNNESIAANDTDRAIQHVGSAKAETANNAQGAEKVVSNEAFSNTAGGIAKNNSSRETGSADKENGVLVVYFSATGTTKAVAEKIADITGADIYEIRAAEEYTRADLNWNDSNSRATPEQRDSSIRPEIGSEAVSIGDYSTIYIGYPIWWGEEPRIMDTFVESCRFDGKTLIPFCTSGSSGIGRSARNLAGKAGSGIWMDGKRFGAGASGDEIVSWIEGLK